MRTYGTVRLSTPEGRDFVITPEPHVMVRLKRVFERLPKTTYGSASLLANETNAFELEWFLLRYPMEVESEARARLDELIRGYRERRDLVEDILRDGHRPIPFPMAIQLREYQAVAAELVLRKGSLLLADDVGLGKTAVAIAVLTDPRARPGLVVAYPHLQRQWAAEIAKFAPALRVHILRKGRPYDLGAAPDVIVTTYHKLGGWVEALDGKLGGVVFDEVQELRRSDSMKYRAAKHLAESANLRLGLSATPIYNYGAELHNVVQCLAPGELGTREEFGREWCSREFGDDAVVEDPRALGKFLREEGLMLRRTRTEVGRELPGCSISPYTVDADLEALEDVKVEVEQLARVVLSQTGSSNIDKWKASGELDWRLRQATGIAKAPHVAAFVRLLVESGESVVLYGWHHAVYEAWAKRLEDLNPLFFTGRETTKRREEARRAFMAGESKLLVLSLRAGAGIDGLQHKCRTVVFGELDWSPGVHEQCIGRVYRDGQPEPVMAYYLITEEGSDPVVADVLGLKAGQIEGLKDPDSDLVERLSIDPDHIKRLARAYLKKHGKEAAA